MARGIRIDFLADVRDFLRGTKDVEGSLDDVGQSLDDVAKDGDQAADKLEKSFREALSETSKHAKDAGDDVGKRVQHGAKEASEGMEDFKENTQANLKETAASFGSIEDALGGIQGLASEALEGFGPAGVAAGAAAALGIGIVSSKLTEIAEKTNEAKEEAVSLAQALRDAGSETERAQLLADGYDEVAGKIGDARRAWEVWQKDAVTNAEAFASSIKQGALSVADLQSAFTASDPAERMAAAKRASADLERQLTETEGAWDNMNVSTQVASGTVEHHVRLTQEQSEALKATKRAIDAKMKSDADAQKVLEAYATAEGRTVEAYLAHQQELEKTRESLESYKGALESMADPLDAFDRLLKTSAKKGGITVEEMIHDLEQTAAKRKTFEANLRTLARKGGEGLVAELRAAGPDAAAGVTATLAKATAKDVRAYAAARARVVGGDLGAGIGDGIVAKTDDVTLKTKRALTTAMKATAEDFKKDPPKVDVKTTTDAGLFLRDLQRGVDRGSITVPVVGKTGKTNP